VKTRGRKKDQQARTFHIDALFLPEGSAKILNLGSEAALHVLGGKGIVMGLGGWEGVFWEADLLDKGLTLVEVLLSMKMRKPGRFGSKKMGEGKSMRDGHTRVMSVVRASISLSSSERSENPGSTCFAWSFSRAVTVNTY